MRTDPADAMKRWLRLHPVASISAALFAVLVLAGVTAAVFAGPVAPFVATTTASPAVPASEEPTAEPTTQRTPFATPEPTTERTLFPTAEPTTVTPAPSFAPSEPPAADVDGWIGLQWSAGVVSLPHRSSVYQGGGDTSWMIDDVVAWHEGYVGAGRMVAGMHSTMWAHFFWSDDGLHWIDTAAGPTPRRVISPDGGLGDRWTPQSLQVHVLGDELVALARGRREYLPPDPQAGLVVPTAVGPWTSTDGKTWALVDDSNLGDLSYGMSVRASAAGPAGIVIIGTERGTGLPVSLHSPDGRRWERGVVPETNHATLFDVAATADGFVAGGRESVGEGVRPIAWYSPDGLSWVSADVEIPSLGWDAAEPIGGEGGLARILVGSDGLWALGLEHGRWEPDATPHVAWMSADGRSWRVATPPSTMPAYPVLASDGHRMLMLGPETIAPGPGWGIASGVSGLVGWASLDGAAWTPLVFTGENQTVAPGIQWTVGSGPTDDVVTVANGVRVWVLADRVIVGDANHDQTIWVGTATAAAY